MALIVAIAAGAAFAAGVALFYALILAGLAWWVCLAPVFL